LRLGGAFQPVGGRESVVVFPLVANVGFDPVETRRPVNGSKRMMMAHGVPGVNAGAKTAARGRAVNGSGEWAPHSGVGCFALTADMPAT
jgi:hypothetical protein